MAHLIEARQLHKVYATGEVSVAALRGVDLAVGPGEFLAIMGPSGSGKSTLLHLLGGLEAASSGEVALDQATLADRGERAVTLLRRRRIGVVFQFFNLLPTMTAEENVALPLLLDGRPWAECTLRARVALARALVIRPQVLLADEPTGNLDRAAGAVVLDLLRRACDEAGRTVVMVTHDPSAAARADRVVFLRDGCVVNERRGPGLTAESLAQA